MSEFEPDRNEETRKPTTKHYDKVKQFMQNGGQETPNCVTIPDENTRILRARLMLEEVLEAVQIGLGVQATIINPITGGKVSLDFEGMQFYIARPVNLVELADGCADTKVVTTGTLIAFGIPDDELQDIVDDSNLAKGNVKNAYGKIQKPPGWQPPDVKGFLERLATKETNRVSREYSEKEFSEESENQQTAVKSAMAIKAEQRPANFEQLRPEEQWEIDKGLGILDWDGK